LDLKRGKLLNLVLLLSLMTTACSKAQDQAKAGSTPPTAVQVQTLANGTLQDSTEYVGTLEAAQAVDLKPQIDGRINQIAVRPGARVNRGDVIFTLSLDQTAPQVGSAQANVNAAVAARNNATQQLRVAGSQLSSAQSQYELAQINNTRYQYLSQQGAVNQATAEQYATNLRVQRDAVRIARDQIRAAQEGLNQANANVRSSQANEETARVSLNFKQVAAPIAGIVGNITLKPGDYVTTGQTLTTVNQNNFFDLQIPIPLNHANELRTGLAVQLLDPTSGNQLGSGSIYFVSPQADPIAQVILTRARFPNSNGNLRNAQYVRARVIWQTRPGVLVPTSAVTTTGGQNFVFVAENTTANGKQQTVARQVPVALGAIQGQNYQVLQGLKAGDRVITSGILRLTDGAPVAPQTANAAQPNQS
jgi:RND family efflux transporter MFP subunit